MSLIVQLASMIAMVAAQSAPIVDQSVIDADDAINEITLLAESRDDDDAIRADPAYRMADVAKVKEQRASEVKAVMRMVLTDSTLAERLPLPDRVLYVEMREAMEHDAAWAAGSRKESLETTLVWLSEKSAFASYFEWACQTGREEEVMTTFNSVLGEVLTAYPRRMLFKHATDKRKAFGFNMVSKCSPSSLESSRQDLALQYAIFRWRTTHD